MIKTIRVTSELTWYDDMPTSLEEIDTSADGILTSDLSSLLLYRTTLSGKQIMRQCAMASDGGTGGEWSYWCYC
jgi:hypothetical protein